ncbi:MAG: coat protein [Cressdnaviricota sp.]|nr:MAG: coat protein [Cressdnaviricota sp.]
MAKTSKTAAGRSMKRSREDYMSNMFDGSGTKKVRKVVQSEIRKREIRTTELKEYTDSFGGTLFPSLTGSVISVTDAIAQGEDMFERNGRYIYMKMIRIKFSVAAGVTNWADCGRFYLVYDKQPNAGTSAFSDIFQTASGATAGSAFKNTLVNGDRYVIVREVKWDCSYNGDQYKNYDIFYKVPDKLAHTVYPGSSTTEAQTGAWLICYGADRNTTTSTQMIANVKLQFTDK